jgi:hypothetical protein
MTASVLNYLQILKKRYTTYLHKRKTHCKLGKKGEQVTCNVDANHPILPWCLAFLLYNENARHLVYQRLQMSIFN